MSPTDLVRVDPDWSWIEGRRPNSRGRETWWPLYCHRKDDLIRAQEALRHIRNMVSMGKKVPDNLDAFSEFRLIEAGEPSDSLDTLEELRSTAGGFALTRALRNSDPRCGVIHPVTGAICTKPPLHKGKHKSS